MLNSSVLYSRGLLDLTIDFDLGFDLVVDKIRLLIANEQKARGLSDLQLSRLFVIPLCIFRDDGS